MSQSELLLIDLSSLAHPIWHMSGSEPDPNWTSTQIVARVRALASSHPHAAICCDSRKSFRKELDPTYKANRDSENRAVLYHQIGLALERLREDNFPIWTADGFEADDLIASATAQALAMDADVLIATADKDLLQLVSERVTVKNVAPNANGNLRDVAAVVEKFGVRPEQMLDWLSLVGDASDNVVGAKGVGAVTATKLLTQHGTIAAIYEAMQHGVVPGLSPTVRNSFVEFQDRWPTVRQLITLRTDAPVPMHEIAVEREAKPMEEAVEQKTLSEMTDAEFATFEGSETVHNTAQKVADAYVASLPLASSPSRELTAEQATAALGAVTAKVAERIAPKPTDIAVSQPPMDFSQQLEPRNIEEAKTLAKYAFASRMFSAYGTEQAVLMVLMAGRELGMTAMASLRGFHLVEGRATLSADLIRALIIRSGKAKYFRPTERTATSATWETQRGDDPPVSLTFTMEEAHQAGVVRKGSGWEKFPADMLTARASAKLARLVYSDVVFNLYDPSEL